MSGALENGGLPTRATAIDRNEPSPRKAGLARPEAVKLRTTVVGV